MCKIIIMVGGMLLVLLLAGIPANAVDIVGQTSPQSLSVISPGNAANVSLLQLLELGHVHQIVWSSDGELLALATSHTYLYDTETFEQIYEFKSVVWANSIAFSPDGTMLATATHEGVKLWDVPGGGERLDFAGSGDTKSVMFSPDGTVLATGTGHTIKLWDVENGSELRTIPVGDTVNSVAFSPDGQMIASGGCRDVKLWDAATGDELYTLTGHSNHIKSVTFSPDGTMLASGSFDKTIRLWDVAEGRQIRALSGHTGYVEDVAFSPDGRTIASISWDLTVKLWDVVSGNELRSLTGHTDWGACVAFSADGTILASSAYSGAMRLWGTMSNGGDGPLQTENGDPTETPVQTPTTTSTSIIDGEPVKELDLIEKILIFMGIILFIAGVILIFLMGIILFIAGIGIIFYPKKAVNVMINIGIGIPGQVNANYRGGIGLILIVIGYIIIRMNILLIHKVLISTNYIQLGG